jgi:hypothetical protein
VGEVDEHPTPRRFAQIPAPSPSRFVRIPAELTAKMVIWGCIRSSHPEGSGPLGRHLEASSTDLTNSGHNDASSDLRTRDEIATLLVR